MLVEAGVFSRHKRLNQLARHLINRHNLAPFKIKFTHQAPVVTKNLGHDRRLVIAQPINTGKFCHQIKDITGDSKQRDHPKRDRKQHQRGKKSFFTRRCRGHPVHNHNPFLPEYRMTA